MKGGILTISHATVSKVLHTRMRWQHSDLQDPLS